MAKLLAKKKSPRVKWKIFLFLLGFCLLLLVILWLFQTVFLDAFYAFIKLRQVEKEASSLASLLESGDYDTFEETIRARGDMYVELVDADGKAQAVGGFFPEFGMGFGDDEQRAGLYAKTRENGGTLSMRYNAKDFPNPEPGKGGGQNTPPPGEPGQGQPPDKQHNRMNSAGVLHAELVTTADGNTTLLMVRAIITPVNATVETLRTQLVFISIITLALAVGIALLIASRVSKPIARLNSTAAQLAKGNYTVTFQGGGYREVDELSATLNLAAHELDKTEELRRDLIANVSHDLRTPLTLITGYAEMMRDIPGENTPENMQVIIDEARRLNSLVGDLLDLSRLQSGTTELSMETFDLTGEVEAIIDRFNKFGEPEGYSVRFLPAKGEAMVKADVQRISQVVYNFLINAMTHGGEDKAISVSLQKEDGRAVLSVTDTGEGIPADQLPYIWDRYYKADAPHKRAIAGAGLGLSIVKNILQQHPGVEYGVESNPGSGSTFWFSLPLST